MGNPVQSNEKGIPMAPHIQNSAKGLALTYLVLRFVVIFLGIAMALSLSVPAAADEDSLRGAFKQGKFILDGRLRYENVKAANFLNNGEGLTFRARFGFQTAPYKGIVLLAEGDFTRDLGVNDFNSTVNGKTQFPVIADPDSARLNRLSITYSGLEKFTFAAGRQRLILDNARFVGNVGFRQNEQTFDSALFQTTIIKDVSFTYVYVWQVNRIFGSQSPVGQLDTNTHLFNVSYGGLPVGKITGYAYFMNIDGAAAASNQTFGIRLTGEQNLGSGIKAIYVAGYAHQKDYKNNPGNFSLGFLELEGGFLYKGVSAKVGFELLEGNGTQGFTTPLATGHAFQGFADQFLTTPASGIEDLYFVVGYKKEDIPTWGTVSLAVWYHDFSPDIAAADLGEEIDFRFAVSPVIKKQKVTFALLFADFSGSPVVPDVRKIWLTAEFAF